MIAMGTSLKQLDQLLGEEEDPKSHEPFWKSRLWHRTATPERWPTVLASVKMVRLLVLRPQLPWRIWVATRHQGIVLTPRFHQEPSPPFSFLVVKIQLIHLQPQQNCSWNHKRGIFFTEITKMMVQYTNMPQSWPLQSTLNGVGARCAKITCPWNASSSWVTSTDHMLVVSHECRLLNSASNKKCGCYPTFGKVAVVPLFLGTQVHLSDWIPKIPQEKNSQGSIDGCILFYYGDKCLGKH